MLPGQHVHQSRDISFDFDTWSYLYYAEKEIQLIKPRFSGNNTLQALCT